VFGLPQSSEPGKSPGLKPGLSRCIRRRIPLAPLIVSLALGFLPIGANAADKGPPYEESIQRARQALARVNMEAALSYLDHALRLDPSQSVAFLLLGETYIQTGRYSEAATILQRGVELEEGDTPRRVTMLHALAFALHRAEHDGAAIQALLQVLKATPRQQGLHLLLGRIYMRAGQLDLAMEQFRQEIALHAPPAGTPTQPEPGSHLASAISGLGAAAYRMGDHQGAIAILGRMSSFEALYNLGLAMAAKERYQDAAMKLRQALELDPDHRGALQNMARCAAALKRDDERDQVLARLQDLYRKEQEDKAEHSRIGNILASARQKIESDDRAGAVAALQEVPREPPLEMRLLMELGRVQYDAGAHRESEESFREILSRQPLQSQPYFWLGRIQEDRGDLAGAGGLFRRAIQLSPVETEYYGRLAQIYFRLERPEDAMRELALASRLRPDDAAGHYNLGKGLLRTGALEQAAAELETAVRLGRDGPEVLSGRRRPMGAPVITGIPCCARVRCGSPLRRDHRRGGRALPACQRSERREVLHGDDGIGGLLVRLRQRRRYRPLCGQFGSPARIRRQRHSHQPALQE
jgi:tetratricopeptide (TPR) repeat protein